MARLAPEPSALTEEYWAAANRNELVVQRCRGCDGWLSLPEEVCPQCGGTEFGFEPVDGRGTVHTFSVVHRTFAPGFSERVPYVIAWIELDQPDGVRLFGNILTDDVFSVRIGQPVEVVFEELPGFGLVPNFRCAEADATE